MCQNCKTKITYLDLILLTDTLINHMPLRRKYSVNLTEPIPVEDYAVKNLNAYTNIYFACLPFKFLQWLAAYNHSYFKLKQDKITINLIGLPLKITEIESHWTIQF